MTARKREVAGADKDLRAFVREVSERLLAGEQHRTPGFGTFSTCTRKRSVEAGGGKMAIFRASAEFRAHASGAPRPPVTGPHAEIVNSLVDAMIAEPGIDVPRLGRLAIVREAHEKPKLILHAAKALNDRLASVGRSVNA